MRQIKKNIVYGLIIIVMSSFSQCSEKELQAQAPVELGDVYCQSWVAGVEGGGGGLNIFIPASDASVTLKQVYFRGKIANLEQRNGLYVGRYKTDINKSKDILLEGANSSNSKESKEKEIDIPFKLNDNECVVSYLDGKKTKYFKIENIDERPMQALPSAPKGGDVQIKNL